MGLLRSLARGVGSRISPALWGAGIGAGLGGSVSAMGGGSAEDVGRAALYGGAAGGIGGAIGGPFNAGPLLLGAGVGGVTAGAMNRGDPVDAAARMILMQSRSTEDIPRAAELLFGGQATQDEMGYGRYGRSNKYGVSASDQMLANLPPDQQQAAVRRAYELSQQQQ